MQATQPIQIGSLPLAITFFSNGCIALQPLGSFNVIFDQQPDKEDTVISCDELLISGNSFVYNQYYELAHEPILKQWLVEQHMISPL